MVLAKTMTEEILREIIGLLHFETHQFPFVAKRRRFADRRDLEMGRQWPPVAALSRTPVAQSKALPPWQIAGPQ
jgi:hypothetical protein